MKIRLVEEDHLETLVLNGPVLLVDDDEAIVSFLKAYLEALGCRIVTASNGREALDAVNKISPAFIILDLMMPFMDGYAACEEIRKLSGAPILMLTAKMDEDDKVRGLLAGADDYLTKPFSPRELAARMQAILRRISGSREHFRRIRVADFEYDEERHHFSWKGTPLYFTFQEAKILIHLAENKTRILTREQLLEVLYPAGDSEVTDRIIDVHIGNIRHKFRAIDSAFDLIITCRGIGYSMKEEPYEN
ncbi:response regulator transcription factor [Paenibacillus filicis]|uniref:Response regulator transcription factor n=1 Tax=Paenibacillus gyeongsangnamensis TaxID=3388067 RepID=A0ABT4QA60_9BACL|nr:response regulator transcription factor [Paenibacillus filicis]MCZ8513704.1 response regulator transcription factor [Paenibacillus filicis]